MDLDRIKDVLRTFAEVEARGVSPLYEHLALQAAADDDVAGLLSAARDGEVRATLLMATAHRLVQADPIHPLSRYYPSLGGFDGVDSETWPLFRSFLLERADKARALIASRYTQTNEVRRAALLYPGVARAAKRSGRQGVAAGGRLQRGTPAGPGPLRLPLPVRRRRAADGGPGEGRGRAALRTGPRARERWRRSCRRSSRCSTGPGWTGRRWTSRTRTSWRGWRRASGPTSRTASGC